MSALINVLVKKSIGGKFGARDLRKNVRREVEDRIAQLLVDTCDRKISGITLTAEDGCDYSRRGTRWQLTDCSFKKPNHESMIGLYYRIIAD